MLSGACVRFRPVADVRQWRDKLKPKIAGMEVTPDAGAYQPRPGTIAAMQPGLVLHGDHKG
jgi:hypothetical protein